MTTNRGFGMTEPLVAYVEVARAAERDLGCQVEAVIREVSYRVQALVLHDSWCPCERCTALRDVQTILLGQRVSPFAGARVRVEWTDGSSLTGMLIATLPNDETGQGLDLQFGTDSYFAFERYGHRTDRFTEARVTLLD